MKNHSRKKNRILEFKSGAERLNKAKHSSEKHQRSDFVKKDRRENLKNGSYETNNSKEWHRPNNGQSQIPFVAPALEYMAHSKTDSTKQYVYNGKNLPSKKMHSSFGLPADLGETSNPHKKFLKAVELSPSLILITDRRGYIEYANPKFLDVSEYSLADVEGKELGMFKVHFAAYDEFQKLRQAIVKGTEWKGELLKAKKSGERFMFSASVSPVRNDYGYITNFIIVGQDITPFRETERKLKTAVEEKTVLLSELHHRVKNNLAIISGLIQLQAFSESDNRVKSKLLSSVGRVQTMASMHELLYESGSFSKLEFGENVRKIVTTISKMYYDQAKNIEVRLDVESVSLNINQAHPCSLIINEVITNAFKHAFNKNGKKGKIIIQLYTQSKTVYLSIMDNGIGLPEDFEEEDQAEKYLGSTLLKTLVQQLYGTYSYSSDAEGTTFTLKFDKEDVKGTANSSLT